MKRMPVSQRDSGFTLIEMLVVLLIMGIFVGLVSTITQPDERAMLGLEGYPQPRFDGKWPTQILHEGPDGPDGYVTWTADGESKVAGEARSLLNRKRNRLLTALVFAGATYGETSDGITSIDSVNVICELSRCLKKPRCLLSWPMKLD